MKVLGGINALFHDPPAALVVDGAALQLAAMSGDDVAPLAGPDLGRSWSAVAECPAHDGVIAWFQGRSEYGPRARGHRSLLAHPLRSTNVDRRPA